MKSEKVKPRMLLHPGFLVRATGEREKMMKAFFRSVSRRKEACAAEGIEASQATIEAEERFSAEKPRRENSPPNCFQDPPFKSFMQKRKDR